MLAGCDTDDFVIAGETDGCSSGEIEGHALDACVGDECDEAVRNSSLAERQRDDLELSRPTRAPVQERR
jgi:hypothetical protein